MRPDPVVRLEGLVGPLGFEPRTDGLKVSGSRLKRAGAKHQKRPKMEVSGQKSTQQRSLSPPSRYKV